MTWNIHKGRGIDGRSDIDRTAEILLQADADLVCLNETQRILPFGKYDQPRYLAGATGYYLYAKPSLSLWPYSFGQAILSRHPLKPIGRRWISWWPEPRAVAQALVGLENVDLTVVAVHLDSHPGARLIGAGRLGALIDELPRPLVLAGDFNAPPQTHEIALFASKLADCAPDGGPTFPAPAPTARLDYVFTSNDCAIIDCGTIETDASDHLPVYATIEVGAGRAAEETQENSGKCGKGRL